MKKTILALITFLVAAYLTLAQGTFQNLGFESATLVPIPGDPDIRVQFAPALPAWNGYIGSAQQDAALYNWAFLDSSGIAILDAAADSAPIPVIHGRLIQGEFTALLMAGFALGTFDPSDTTLAQAGFIPVGTESLFFRADTPYPGSFAVTLGGQPLSLITIGTDANSTIYGADIHAWAGQSAQLAFTVFAQRPHVSNVYLFLDDIRFSNVPIPEPNSVGLLGVAALLLGWRFRRNQT
jgi:hypothetical protein